MVALILFDTPANLPGTPGFDPSKPVSPGFFAGWQTVTHTVRFADADHLTSAGTNEFFKANGDRTEPVARRLSPSGSNRRVARREIHQRAE